jgi:phosphoglycolate phosphatase-like HAD superfamily hydrolase
VQGALEFLEKYSKRLRLFIASSTPEEELLHLVKSRGLQKYFHGIYGAPLKKSEIVSQIIEEAGVEKREVLFVGDSAADFEEAKKAGVRFIGRVANLADCPFPDGVKTVRDLKELSSVVEQLSCQ